MIIYASILGGLKIGVLRGRNKRDEDDGVKRGLLKGPMEPETCKKLKGKPDKKTGDCIIQYEKKEDKPKELKTIEYDEYSFQDEEGGVENTE